MRFLHSLHRGQPLQPLNDECPSDHSDQVNPLRWQRAGAGYWGHLCRAGADQTVALFAPIFLLNKNVRLSRQARDKHRENSKKDAVFRTCCCFEAGCRVVGSLRAIVQALQPCGN